MRLWATAGCEPTLEEVMSDPLVALVMRRDRLTRENVWAAIRVARRRLRNAAEPVEGIAAA